MKSTHVRLVEATTAFSASAQLEAELAKDRWDAHNIPGLHYAPHTGNNYVNFLGVPERFRPLVKDYVRFLLASGRAAITLDHAAYYLGHFFTFFVTHYPSVYTLHPLTKQDVDAFIVSLRADAQTRGVKNGDRYVWQHVFSLEGLLSYLERTQSPVRPVEPTTRII